MERREAVTKMSWILKSVIVAPSLLVAINGCQNKITNVHSDLVLTANQHKLVNHIADTIIPRTTTPSASDVKVGQFIDLLLKDVFDTKTVTSFISGLEQFNKDCKRTTGKEYENLPPEKQFLYLKDIDVDIMQKDYDDYIPFYYSFKHLIINIYFSTKEGITQNLNYLPVPGPYVSEIEYKKGDKIIVGNKM